MALAMMIMSVCCMLGGFAVGACCTNYARKSVGELTVNGRMITSALALFPILGGLVGLLWCFLSPPPFSIEVAVPSHFRNDPTRSVYFGNGCFWHTQYDMVVLEQDATGPFGGRSDEEVTSLVGYAGGNYMSPIGTACYHGLPTTDYNRLGHSEAVSLTLDEISGPVAQRQLAAAAAVYFGEHGFQTLDDGRRQRLDPQDAGPEYRNVIGLPGGMDNAELWPVIEAANVHGMSLERGLGGPSDDREDQFVVYVYDSEKFSFFRGETSHQFHANTVVGRSLPKEYLVDLKAVQKKAGRMDDDLGCTELPFAEITLLIVFSFGVLFGLGTYWVVKSLPSKIRFWEQHATSVQPTTVRVDTLEAER